MKVKEVKIYLIQFSWFFEIFLNMLMNDETYFAIELAILTESPFLTPLFATDAPPTRFASALAADRIAFGAVLTRTIMTAPQPPFTFGANCTNVTKF